MKTWKKHNQMQDSKIAVVLPKTVIFAQTIVESSHSFFNVSYTLYKSMDST